MASADAAPHGNVKLKVVCYTIPMMGHALPLLSLAKTMAQRGHQMIFVSSKGLSQMNDLCSAVNVHYEGLEDGLSTEALKAIPDPTGPVFQEYFKKHEKFMLELLDREAPDLVLADYASGAAITAAREKKTLVVLNMALPGTLAYRMRILRFPVLRHVAPLITDRTQLYPVMFIGQVSLPAAEKTLTIVNTCPAMDGGVQLPPNYFSSGPLDGFEKSELNSERHIDILAFLEKANAAKMPVAYITTGSLTQLSEEQIKALYDGFAACDVWVIWSLKKEKQALLKDLPERFHVSAWVPQAQIIQRPELMCVLTHCGWGGTMETMMAGKPVICYPGFGDQHENAKLLNSLGCGPILNPLKCTAKDVQAALEEVIANREAFTKKAQEVGKSLRESPGPVKTVELIEDVAKNGLGSLVDQPYHLSEPTGCQIS